jgi:hypothetical protein
MAGGVRRLASVVLVSIAAIAGLPACSAGSSPAPGTAGHDGSAAGDAPTGDDGMVGADSGEASSRSGDAPAGGTADATMDAGGSCVAPPTPDAGACNAVRVTGSPVPVRCAGTQTPPTPSGGTIADGTYVLTSSTYYGSCPAPEQDRITWSICGGTWQTAQEGPVNGTTMVQLFDAVVSPSGNSLNIRLTCGQMQTTTFGFDATPTTLTLFTWAPTGTPNGRMDVFMRQ